MHTQEYSYQTPAMYHYQAITNIYTFCVAERISRNEVNDYLSLSDLFGYNKAEQE